MDKFDAQLVLYKGMFTGETSLKCKRNWTPSRTSLKKQMINPLHILEGWRNVLPPLKN
jgi:hypothetical protein